MSMTVSELQEKRCIAWEAAKEFLETHRMDNGLIPAADVRTYEKMEQDIQNYSEEIARLERLQKLDDAMRRPTSEPLTRRPGKSAAGRASDEYRSAMLTALRSNFKDVILFYVKNIAYPITPSNADNSFLSKVVDSLAQTINHLF